MFFRSDSGAQSSSSARPQDAPPSRRAGTLCAPNLTGPLLLWGRHKSLEKDKISGKRYALQIAIVLNGTGAMTISLASKRILVTGSGTGIGRSIALEFARAGADLVL